MQRKDAYFPPEKALDGDNSTCFITRQGDPMPWLVVDLKVKSFGLFF